MMAKAASAGPQSRRTVAVHDLDLERAASISDFMAAIPWKIWDLAEQPAGCKKVPIILSGCK